MCDASSSLRRLALLLLLVISTENALAQLTLGYCDEEGYTSSLTNSSTESTISCAMGLTPALQADYTFCSISYLRILLTAPENLTSFKVWLRKDLNDVEDLSSIDIEPSALVEGWNDIALPDSIRLTGAETYYCGYSYRQSAKTRIPLSGTKGTDESFYVSTGGTWRDMSNRYAPVCIRVGLSSNYQYAMELLDLRLNHRWFDIHSEGDTVVLRGSIRNLGSDPLHQFRVSVEEADLNRHEATYDCASTGFGYSVPFEFSFPRSGNITSTSPDIPIRLAISQPNGQENQCDHATRRTESNGYAPAGQTHLRNSIERALQCIPDAHPDVIILSRHEGYGPADAWRIAGSDYKASFFGPEELTFAPAAMVCRNGLPFSTTLDEDSIAQLISERLNVQYGSIRFDQVTFDADTRTVSATLTTHLYGVSAYRNPTLVVCIKQDKAASVAQKNYYPTLYDSDWQRDVVRCFIPLPHEGRLLGDADPEAVAAGLVQVSDCVDRQFTISRTLPSDITSKEGLSLVAYIFDNNYTDQIIAVSQSKF